MLPLVVIAAFVAIVIAIVLKWPKPAAAVEDPGALRAELERAVHAGDARALDRLCRANEHAIVAAFPGWARRDPALGKPDRAEVERMIHFLGTLAEHMREALGRPEPWDQLTAPPGGNPITTWEADLARSQELEQRSDFDSAIAVLEATLERTGPLAGSAADRLRPITEGRLGTALFHAGRVEDARVRFERALAACEAIGDRAGARAYRSSLYEVARWLGRGEEASEHASALAQILIDAGETDAAHHYANQAILVRGGEPKARLVGRIGSRTYELDDAAEIIARGGPVTVQFEWVRDRITLGSARARIETGIERAERGDLPGALAAWEEAAAKDPCDPAPHYQSAIALLQLERIDDAMAALERTEALAPGWFMVRQYFGLARDVSAGRLGPWAIAAAIAVLEDGGASPAERVRVARAALERAPGFGWMRVQLGRALRASGDALGAARVQREALETETDPVLVSELAADLASAMPKDDEGRGELIERALAPGGAPMAAAAARVMRRV